MQSFANEDLLRAVIDAIPSPLFIVENDVRIVAFNEAGARLLKQSPVPLHTRAGDALHCIHSLETPHGCGRAEACASCVVRNAVGESFQNRRVVRRGQRMILADGAQQSEVYLLVTTSPIRTEEGSFVMLLLEDIGELVEVRRLLPICMHCGKVRDEDSYWSGVDTYFKKHLDLDFSHGLCDDCMHKHYPDLLDATD